MGMQEGSRSMSSGKDKFDLVAATICGKHKDLDVAQCFALNSKSNPGCLSYNKCRIGEKNGEQLGFVLQPIAQNSFLMACAGSGKTEVVGLKAAYEIRKWESSYSGIAILTFTNNAANVIRERALQFAGSYKASYPHFIGTFDSWLHGYLANPFLHLITRYKGKDNDRSIKIVNDRSDAGFLNAYKTRYQYWATGYVKANEYSLDIVGKIVFSSGNRLIDQIRNKNLVGMEDWRRVELFEVKKNFWQAGFANYEDIEYLCSSLLNKQKDIAAIISRRFPIIIVDECQDLAESQLQILQTLLDCGVKLHFVGDLNQSIYSFRNVDPDLVRQFVQKNGFIQSKLTKNFRSFQPIVDFSGKLVEQEPIIGKSYSNNKSICLYVTYEKRDMNLLPNRFLKLLKDEAISVSESAILTRNNNTIAKLRPSVGGDLKNSMLPAAAIKIWKTKDISIDQINEALSCMGKFMAYQYFSSNSSNKTAHYCPENVRSHMIWRIFVSDILDMSCGHQELSNLNRLWKEWANLFRKNFDNIIEQCQNKYDDMNIDISQKTSQYRAPGGDSGEIVSTSLEVIESALSEHIRITNFHQIKGETKEAVMVVSSPTNQGGGEGFWRNWLQDKKSENARFAYVASSRPKMLLVWAIPNPIKVEDKAILENLGLVYAKEF